MKGGGAKPSLVFASSTVGWRHCGQSLLPPLPDRVAEIAGNLHKLPADFSEVEKYVKSQKRKESTVGSLANVKNLYPAKVLLFCAIFAAPADRFEGSGGPVCRVICTIEPMVAGRPKYFDTNKYFSCSNFGTNI